MAFADFIEPRLVKEEGPLVVRRVFVHLGHRQGVHGTGFHAIAAEDAFGDVDVKFLRVPLQWERAILFADHLDAA